MSCSMQSKTRVVTLWTYDSHVSKEKERKKETKKKGIQTHQDLPPNLE